MSSLFHRTGSSYWPTNDANLDIRKELPIGTYLVGVHPQRGYFLELIEDFSMPKKIYGDTEKRVQRVINTFNDRPGSTGIILAGEKGSGKTLLAKMLSTELAKDGVITIVVNAPYAGDGFNQLIQGIEQPAYVLFDEYEKVYSEPADQNALLTLFDGLFATKKLFGVTCNDKWKLSEFMRNRPGRFFYKFEYAGLDAGFIREYLKDNLNNAENVETFVRYASTYDAFNFDMLQALCEEMNRYDENVIDSAKYVNVEQAYGNKWSYDVVSVFLKKPIDNYIAPTDTFNGGRSFNPFSSPASLYYTYTFTSKDGKESWEESDCIDFTPLDIKSFTDDGGITYENEEAIVTVKRHFDEKFDMSKIL
jgi:SpoVK/Ycf46/Vps4 family AAA+-type ATPase